MWPIGRQGEQGCRWLVEHHSGSREAVGEGRSRASAGTRRALSTQGRKRQARRSEARQCNGCKCAVRRALAEGVCARCNHVFAHPSNRSCIFVNFCGKAIFHLA